jgi:hypothetical protein
LSEGNAAGIVSGLLVIRPQSAASTVQFTLRERLNVSLLVPTYDCRFWVSLSI